MEALLEPCRFPFFYKQKRPWKTFRVYCHELEKKSFFRMPVRVYIILSIDMVTAAAFQ